MHVVLLGDSIFDNGAYVPNGPSVHQQLQAELGADHRVTLLAVDGDVTADVLGQLQGLPADATHLVVSCGGNDALGYLPELAKPAQTVADALVRFGAIREVFRGRYRGMLAEACKAGRPVYVCTVYEQVPTIGETERAALAMFNEIVLKEAQGRVAGIIDLRLICHDPADYSELSPIEPSAQGGAKITRAIRSALQSDGTHVVTEVLGADSSNA